MLSDVATVVKFVPRDSALRLPEDDVAYASVAQLETDSDTAGSAHVFAVGWGDAGWREGNEEACGWQTWDVERVEGDWQARVRTPLGTCG